MPALVRLVRLGPSGAVGPRVYDQPTDTNWVIAILTAFLVLATIYYAVQTHQTVEEMRRTVEEMKQARKIQVMPKLILAIQKLGPNDLLPRVVNMGVGSALHVKVKVTLEPDGPSADYRAAFMSPGRGASLILRRGSQSKQAPGFMFEVGEFEAFESLHVEGECKDALGEVHPVDEHFDLRGYIADFKSGMWARITTVEKEGEPQKLMADALVNIEHLMRLEQESD